jgi:hypothetical protein
MSLPVVQSIFKARELILGSDPDTARRPRGLLELTKSIGWGVGGGPRREIVMGAVTQPWHANVVFRPLPPDEFAAFNEPGTSRSWDAARRSARRACIDLPH